MQGLELLSSRCLKVTESKKDFLFGQNFFRRNPLLSQILCSWKLPIWKEGILILDSSGMESARCGTSLGDDVIESQSRFEVIH